LLQTKVQQLTVKSAMANVDLSGKNKESTKNIEILLEGKVRGMSSS
jgi:hypothetical protein